MASFIHFGVANRKFDVHFLGEYNILKCYNKFNEIRLEPANLFGHLVILSWM